MMLLNEEAQHDQWRDIEKNKQEGRKVDDTKLERPNYQALVVS
jgi:hypothetical protein